MSTYQLEYAHSSRGKCAACRKPFEDDTLRVSVHGSGHHVQNRHLSCVTARVAKNALAAHGGSVEGLPGFEGLKQEDRETVQQAFGEMLKEDSKAAAAKPSAAPGGKRKAASPAAHHAAKRAKTGPATRSVKTRAGAKAVKAAGEDQGDKDEDMAEQGEAEHGDRIPVEGGEDGSEGAAAVEMDEVEEEQGSEGKAGDEGAVAAAGKGGRRGKAGAAGAKKGAAGAKAAAGGQGRAAKGKGKTEQEDHQAGAKGAKGQEDAEAAAGKEGAAEAGKQPGQGGVQRQGLDLTEGERQAPAAVGDSGTGTAPPDPRQEEQRGGEAAGVQQQQGPGAKDLESLEAAEAAQAAEAVAGHLAEATIGPEAFEHREQSLGNAGKG